MKYSYKILNDFLYSVRNSRVLNLLGGFISNPSIVTMFLLNFDANECREVLKKTELK
jgi:hypothetical protein